MPKTFSCPTCGQVVSVLGTAGPELRCPSCNALMTPVVLPPVAGNTAWNTPASPTVAPVRQGLAIASLVLGVLGLLTACFPILGLVGLILGIVSLAKASSRPGEYGGKGKAIGGICTGIISLVVTAPVLVMAFVLSSSAENVGEGLARHVCAGHMNSIATAISSYAEAHHGQLPPNLDVLVSNGTLARRKLKCPSAPLTPYTYVTGLSRSAPPGTPMLYEAIGHHENGANICFADGHVRFVAESEYGRIINGAGALPASRPISKTVTTRAVSRVPTTSKAR